MRDRLPEYQIEVFAFPGQPLKEQDWLDNGYTSLRDYLMKTIQGHSQHKRLACPDCEEISVQPFARFGAITTKGKETKMICKTPDDLPTQDIDGVLIFNKHETSPVAEAEASV